MRSWQPQGMTALYRSLIAAYEITKLDITNGAIGVLKGGFGEWQRSGR